MMTLTRRAFSLALPASALSASVLSAGAARAQGENITLTVYNAQHVSLTKAWAEGFTAETGIKTSLRNGNDTELGNLLVQEGAASPADVFLTENSPRHRAGRARRAVRDRRPRNPRPDPAQLRAERRQMGRDRGAQHGAGL